MAAPRPHRQLFVKFGTLIKDSPFYTYTKFYVSHCSSLAPPLGQSWTFVSTRNFWTVWLIFKNEVPLDSLDQDEFNTLYDVKFRLYRFSAISGFIKNLWKHTPPTILFQCSPEVADIIVRATFTQALLLSLIFKTVCLVQPIKIGNKATKQEFGSNLSKSLRYQHHTWYMGGRH